MKLSVWQRRSAAAATMVQEPRSCRCSGGSREQGLYMRCWGQGFCIELYDDWLGSRLHCWRC